MTQQALRELVELAEKHDALVASGAPYALCEASLHRISAATCEAIPHLKALLGEQREAQAAKIRELEKEFRETAETLAGTASAAGVLACADRLSAVIRGTKT